MFAPPPSANPVVAALVSALYCCSFLFGFLFSSFCSSFLRLSSFSHFSCSSIAFNSFNINFTIDLASSISSFVCRMNSASESYVSYRPYSICSVLCGFSVCFPGRF